MFGDANAEQGIHSLPETVVDNSIIKLSSDLKLA